MPSSTLNRCADEQAMMLEDVAYSLREAADALREAGRALVVVTLSRLGR